MPLVVWLLSQQTTDDTHVDPSSIIPSMILVGIACFGAIYLILSRSNAPPIALPTSQDDPLLPDNKDEIVHPDEQTNVEAFQQKLRTRKLGLLTLLVLLTALSLFTLTWNAMRQARWELTVDAALGVVQWGIAATLAGLSLPLGSSKRDVDRHWSYTVVLTIVTFATVVTTFMRLILPTSASIAPPEDEPLFVKRLSFGLTYSSAVLQLVAFMVAGTTPRCAPLVTVISAARHNYSDESDTIANDTDKVQVTSYTTCSPLSFVLFSWLDPVLKLGSTLESLSQEDLPTLGINDRAPTVFAKMAKTTEKGCPRWMNGLLFRVLKVNKVLFMWQGLLAGTDAFLYYLPAFFLQRLVAFLEVPNDSDERSKQPMAWGYVYCLGLLVSYLLEALVGNMLWFVSNSMLSTRIRVQLNTLIFDKTLRRKDVIGAAGGDSGSSDDGDDDNSSSAKDDKASEEGGPNTNFGNKSQVLNLFTIDVDRVADFAIWCFSIIDTPLEIFIGTYFLWKLLGQAAFWGILVAVVFLPANHFTSKAFADVQDKLMSSRDRRVSLMNEVLASVRFIKYMAIETPFEEKIMTARKVELSHLRRNFYLEVAFNGIWSVSPILCVLVSFYVYTTVMGQDLTPSKAFASLAVWNELRFALNVIPEIVVNAIQCLTSLRRIDVYLHTPEVSMLPGSSGGPTLEPIPVENKIAFVSATVTWPRKIEDSADNSKAPSGTSTPAPRTFELQDLDATFPIGEMSLICGSLGAGKTLLLLSLLGEADVLSGQVICPRSQPDAIALPSIDWDSFLTTDNWIQPGLAAFVPQSAWLQNASVRANICFGLPFRPDRYHAVLNACSLVSDLAILEDGDQTEIGEKGINLSGGQKARVSLARAVYSRAATLLADDVLAAVDASTAAHIFNQCLKGPLMKGRTLILVSHHVQLCAPGAAYVVNLENGRIKYSGGSKEFLESGGFRNADDEEDVVETKQTPIKPRNKQLTNLVAESTVNSADTSSASETEESESEVEDGIELQKEKENKKKKDPRKLIDDEQKAVGAVKKDVWKLYLGLSGGIMFWIVFVLSFGGAKLSEVAQTFWLNIWAASYDSKRGKDPHNVAYYLNIYALLSILAVIVGTLQWYVLYIGSLRASDSLYRKILHSILRAPLRFFDTQALGRLLNRFGKDFENVDAALPDHLGRSLICGLGVMTTLAVVASVAPMFLLGFAFIVVIYLRYARLFAKSARELRRLDSISKSPLYSIYGEAVAGVAVIRAFGASKKFMTLMLERCTTNVTFYWYLWSVNRWLSLRFALLSAIVVALTGYVLILEQNKIDAALAGFALTFSLNISTDMLFLVRRYTALELAMVGVERIKEYSEVEPEASEIIEPRPPSHWPNQGRIEVDRLTIRYAPELPNVLHGVSFKLEPGTRLGVVGATGCGKSTLALSFFRFVEAWAGKIVIDGIDISKVGLKDLRSNLTIIPQDPTILSGTLRTTLDIFNEYEDYEIFDALRRVHLIKPNEDPNDVEEGANRSPFFNLEAEVSEGGNNFSQGQRQLLCMARALLKRNKFMLLDEATASVDYKTDELISNTIREEFKDSTLLVIAHRLRSIIDFDKVLLLDKGQVIEFESPAKLLEDPTSRFYALCRATGKSEFKVLKKMAEGRKKVTMKPRKLRRTSTRSKQVETETSTKTNTKSK
ncbi:hypothetical protein OIO90_004318 [Microbotryomycetes sp. JL221]|nr:hypothetical protein OIO90_004318 [Microbotryomycetes sp. JL221]